MRRSKAAGAASPTPPTAVGRRSVNQEHDDRIRGGAASDASGRRTGAPELQPPHSMAPGSAPPPRDKRSLRAMGCYSTRPFRAASLLAAHHSSRASYRPPSKPLGPKDSCPGGSSCSLPRRLRGLRERERARPSLSPALAAALGVAPGGPRFGLSLSRAACIRSALLRPLLPPPVAAPPAEAAGAGLTFLIRRPKSSISESSQNSRLSTICRSLRPPPRPPSAKRAARRDHLCSSWRRLNSSARSGSSRSWLLHCTTGLPFALWPACHKTFGGPFIAAADCHGTLQVSRGACADRSKHTRAARAKMA